MAAPIRKTVIVAIAAALLVAAAPAQQDEATIAHVFNRLGYGARPGDIEKVRQVGVINYIEQQLHPERIADGALEAKLEPFTTLRISQSALAREYFIPAQQARRQQKPAETPNEPDAAMEGQKPVQRMQLSPALMKARQVMVELDEQKLLRAAYSQRQLQEVLTDFWFNHFNVYAAKGADRQLLTAYERDVIRPNVLGSFGTLLGAVAHSPAMLFYLDNWMSTDPNGLHLTNRDEMRQRNRTRMLGVMRPDLAEQVEQQQKNRPTGLNENYGRELMELHTLGVDGGYTQQDVIEVARAFTGWTIDRPRLGGEFKFDPRMHDPGEKHVLGHTKLARRFVSDEPPQSLVNRAAKRFIDTKGDIREVVRMIVESPEFFAPETQRAKVKTPLEFVVSALRASSAEVRSGMGLIRALQQLGMPLYLAQPPTGYAESADAWMNAGGLVNRMNFAVALADNHVPGVRVDTAQVGALALGAPEFQRK
jgi:uncharacterized protein (DUF1800 family)